MRISDWSSDVCSSDLFALPDHEKPRFCGVFFGLRSYGSAGAGRGYAVPRGNTVLIRRRVHSCGHPWSNRRASGRPARPSLAGRSFAHEAVLRERAYSPSVSRLALPPVAVVLMVTTFSVDRKSTRLTSSH